MPRRCRPPRRPARRLPRRGPAPAAPGRRRAGPPGPGDLRQARRAGADGDRRRPRARSASSLVLLGWWGASQTPNLFEQMPYLISGGLFGLGLVFLGGFLYFAHWLTELVKEHRAQSTAMIEAVNRLEETIGRVAGISGNGSQRAIGRGRRRRARGHRQGLDGPPRRLRRGRRQGGAPHRVPRRRPRALQALRPLRVAASPGSGRRGVLGDDAVGG